jgi:hypothetical protein
MGLSLFGRSTCSCSRKSKPLNITKKLPNPVPDRYRITYQEQIGDYLIVKVEYPDCTNYEGLKIMLYKTTWENLSRQESIDPHFCEDCLSPIARFEPTERGLTMARFLANSMHTSQSSDLMADLLIKQLKAV